MFNYFQLGTLIFIYKMSVIKGNKSLNLNLLNESPNKLILSPNYLFNILLVKIFQRQDLSFFKF
jgi:hypothetical protein